MMVLVVNARCQWCEFRTTAGDSSGDVGDPRPVEYTPAVHHLQDVALAEAHEQPPTATNSFSQRGSHF